jgi:hypothetical protein
VNVAVVLLLNSFACASNKIVQLYG